MIQTYISLLFQSVLEILVFKELQKSPALRPARTNVELWSQTLKKSKKIGKALTFKMKIGLKIQLFGVVAFWLSKWNAINFVKHSSIAGGFVGLVGPNWSMWSLQFGVVRRKTISARGSRPVHLSEFGLWSTALGRISLPLKFKVWTAMLMSSPSFCFSTLSPPPARRCDAL